MVSRITERMVEFVITMEISSYWALPKLHRNTRLSITDRMPDSYCRDYDNLNNDNRKLQLKIYRYSKRIIFTTPY